MLSFAEQGRTNLRFVTASLILAEGQPFIKALLRSSAQRPYESKPDFNFGRKELTPSFASQSQILLSAKKQSLAPERCLNLQMRQTKCGQPESSVITGLIYWVLFSKILFKALRQVQIKYKFFVLGQGGTSFRQRAYLLLAWVGPRKTLR